MKNITVKQESLSNWREEFDIDEAKVDDKHSPEGKEKERNKRKYGNWPVNQGAQTSVRRGIHWSNRGDKKRRGAKVEEHVEGGIQVQNVADGLNFTEIETVDIIKTQPIKGASNWKLEMVTEMLIAEGYNDDEIVTILSEELPKIPLGGILTGAVRGAWNLSTKGVRGAYDLGKGARGILNRGVRDTKLTGDIISTAKKLRNPDGVSITKSPRINTPSKGGGLVKSFKGFMQNVKDAGSNLVNRTKGKLDRINAKKAEIQTTAKDVDVLGGAATTPKPTSTPMKNITPTPIGDGIAKVANQVKTGATAAVAGSGVVAGSKLTSNSPSKVATGTELKGDKPLSASIRGDQKKNAPPVEKKVEAPITNDGKKEVNPSKNEKIDTPPTKRELRNQRNDALSSPEGRRARRDEGLRKAKLRGNPRLQGLEKMKTGTPINQLFNKEEVENIQELDNMGGPAAIGAVVTAGAGLAKSAFDAIKTTTENLKKNKQEKQQKIKNLTQSYSWRDELGFDEGNRTRFKGVGLSGSGNKKDFSKGPNEKVFVDYTKIRANAPVKTDTKVG